MPIIERVCVCVSKPLKCIYVSIPSINKIIMHLMVEFSFKITQATCYLPDCFVDYVKGHCLGHRNYL